jgi:hypothetical protein
VATFKVIRDQGMVYYQPVLFWWAILFVTLYLNVFKKFLFLFFDNYLSVPTRGQLSMQTLGGWLPTGSPKLNPKNKFNNVVFLAKTIISTYS